MRWRLKAGYATSFFEGEVFAMAGKSIAQNLVPALRPALRGKHCQVIMETVQLAVAKTWLAEWYQLSEHGVWGHTALAKAADAVIIPELNPTMTLVQLYEEASAAPMQAGFEAEEESVV